MFFPWLQLYRWPTGEKLQTASSYDPLGMSKKFGGASWGYRPGWICASSRAVWKPEGGFVRMERESATLTPNFEFAVICNRTGSEHAQSGKQGRVLLMANGSQLMAGIGCVSRADFVGEGGEFHQARGREVVSGAKFGQRG